MEHFTFYCTGSRVFTPETEKTLFRADLMFFHFNFQRRRQIEQKKIEEEEEEIRQFGQAKKVTVVNLILYTVDITRKISSILNGREWQVNPTINLFTYCTIRITHTCLLGFSFIYGLNKAD